MPSSASRRALLLSPAVFSVCFGFGCTEGAPGAEPEYVYVTAGQAGEAGSAGQGGDPSPKGGGAGAGSTGGQASGGGGGGAGKSGGPSKGGSSGKGGGTSEGGGAGDGGTGGAPVTSGSGTSCDDPIVMVPGMTEGVFVATGKAITPPVDVLDCAFPGPRAYLKITLPAGNWIGDLDGDGSALPKTAIAVRGSCADPASMFVCAEKASFINAPIGVATPSEVYVIVQGAELEQGFGLTIARGPKDCQGCGELKCSANDVCVACYQETDCEQGVCDEALAYCRKCTGATECAASSRGIVCDEGSGTCGCKVDADCKNVDEGTCVKGTCYSCKSGTVDCNGEAIDGCEVDPQSDAANCGACGKSCGGAVCVSGICAPTPETFATEDARPDLLTTNADALFYARSNNATFPNVLEIVRRPLAGGAEIVLQGFPGGYIQGLSATATTVVAQVATEETDPAAKTVTTFWSFAAAGGGGKTSLTSFEVPSLISEQPMLLDDTHVYWSVRQKNLDTSDTYRAALAGATPPEKIEPGADLLGLTKAHLLLGYHTENYLRDLLRLRPLAGGPAVDLLKDEDIGPVVADETHAYFTWSGEASTSVDCTTLWRVPLVGGKPTQVATTNTVGSCATRIQLGDTHVYADIGALVLKAPKAGGPAAGVFDDPEAVDPFVLGPAHAYWATGSGPYLIRRVPRLP